MGQIAFKFLAGGLAGLLAWMVTEPSAPPPFTKEWEFFELRLIATLGLLVGLAIGGINGWLQGSRRHAFRGILLGALFGAIGAYIGYLISGSIAAAMFGDFTREALPIRVVGRVVVGLGLGGGVGLGIGASGLTFRRTVQGLLGGLLGGLAGGGLFDMVSATLSAPAVLMNPGQTEVGQPGRAALCVLIGAGVGLLIGVVQAAGRTAWVRLRLGRNEGKEWVLDTQTAHIGRDERAHVPLFGDMNVAPLHCSIVRQGDAFWIYDAGTQIGTFLNGQRVAQAPLLPGTVIQVGSFALEFQLRAGSAPARAAERLRGQPMTAPMIQQPVPAQPAPVQPAPTPASAGPSLLAVGGVLSGQRFPLRTMLEIGREGQHVQIADAQASRKHARISMAPTGPMIEDLGSTNGTFVNGQRISTMSLKKGDVVRIGQSEFRVEL